VADRVVTYQAKLMIEDGIQLARRGAIFSARARFIRALRLITQAFDAQGGTRFYSESLARGLRALEEVNDFRPKGSRLEADLDLQRIVQSHRTPVLHSADFHRLTTLVAQQAYHTYAENQLIDATGRDPVAADALFALGKVQGHLSKQRGDASTSGDAAAMSLYQTALTIHPDHHQAANELGVLFARYGQLEDARSVLRHCVRDRTNFPEVWRNLARIHEQLGEVELAKRANHEWQSALRRSSRSAGLAGKPSVQWVDPQTFTKISGPDDQSPHHDIATAQKRPERPAPAVRRNRKQLPLPSTDGQPLSVGQRYGR
jgi:Flp pilus assembly protein TadD